MPPQQILTLDEKSTPDGESTIELATDADGVRSVLAGRLLETMASIRRTGRLVSGRPLELSTLTGSQLDLVRLVHRSPGISVARAAEELRLAANTVSTLVRQLTLGGLLVRRVDPTDRRVARLELSGDTRRNVGAFTDRRIAGLSAAMAQLSLHDQHSLAQSISLLERLAEQLQEREGGNR